MSKHNLDDVGSAQVDTRNALIRLTIVLERKGLLTREEVGEIFDEDPDA